MSKLKIDRSGFIVLKPQPTRSTELKMTITEKGEIKLNAPLVRELKILHTGLLISKDMREIVFDMESDVKIKFNKAGIAKNRELSILLKKARIPLPAHYYVEWNEKYNGWTGKLSISKAK